MKKTLLLLSIFTIHFYAYSQEEADRTDPNEEEMIQESDLPFPIAASKRMSDESYQKKKENWFVTGLPRFGFDPIQGGEIGAGILLFNNNTRDDPFFRYTPYRHRIRLNLRATQFGKYKAAVDLDMPYAFDTKWRIRTILNFTSNPNKLYFGFGDENPSELSFADAEGNVASGLHYSEFRDRASLARPDGMGNFFTDRFINYAQYTKFAWDLIGERTYMQGRLRWVNALGVLYYDYNYYDGELIEDLSRSDNGERIDAIQNETWITRDFERGQNDPNSFWGRNNISGYEGGLSIKYKTGLIYDTRDFEPDPEKGILLETSHGFSFPFMGSDFSFMRHQIQAMGFKTVYKEGVFRNVIAGRFMVSRLHGSDIHWKEVLDVWSAVEGRIGLYGGEDTQRGFKKFRFANLAYAFGTIENRFRFMEWNVWNQNLEFTFVPAFDFGRHAESLIDLTKGNWIYGFALGGRVAWNQSTIIRGDIGLSGEDRQVFIVFGQMF
ncbi:MAG: outer membrane protein assembly factor [Cyclobacteriaceae bacterium]|nr:BamA/TamA family outer membrane protein [Cyclobacteriaceae bacterium]MCH8516585.1 outer membrane protein assembly factor [Cyclobacteriaceae bacterium]